jgi:hypothetical protein
MFSSSKGLLVLGLLVFSASCAEHGSRQDDGYIGYRLDQRGDPESAVYETANTNTDADNILPEDPDVYLNASVSVGEIDIEVDNITAKVNLQADVLKLLHFSAGVDASIDRVKLTIQNVSAKVELEARLENVVKMYVSLAPSFCPDYFLYVLLHRHWAAVDTHTFKGRGRARFHRPEPGHSHPG